MIVLNSYLRWSRETSETTIGDIFENDGERGFDFGVESVGEDGEDIDGPGESGRQLSAALFLWSLCKLAISASLLTNSFFSWLLESDYGKISFTLPAVGLPL